MANFNTAIGMLRQWLNEDRIKDAKLFVTNEQIHVWLDFTIENQREIAGAKGAINILSSIISASKASSIPVMDIITVRDYLLKNLAKLEGNNE